VAKTRSGRCARFDEAVEAAADGVKAFLGVGAEVRWEERGTEAALRLLGENPLAEWAEVPEGFEGLDLEAMLAGALQGGLEAVGHRAAAWRVGEAQGAVRVRKAGE